MIEMILQDVSRVIGILFMKSTTGICFWCLDFLSLNDGVYAYFNTPPNPENLK